jgi:hypothetical protein
MDLEVIGLANVTGLNAVLIFTPLINLYGGALDLGFSYVLAYGPKLNLKADIW